MTDEQDGPDAPAPDPRLDLFAAAALAGLVGHTTADPEGTAACALAHGRALLAALDAPESPESPEEEAR